MHVLLSILILYYNHPCLNSYCSLNSKQITSWTIHDLTPSRGSNFLNWFWVHPAFYSMGTEVHSSQVRQPGSGTVHSPPSYAKFKNECSSISTSCISLYGTYRNYFTQFQLMSILLIIILTQYKCFQVLDTFIQ